MPFLSFRVIRARPCSPCQVLPLVLVLLFALAECRQPSAALLRS